jgi:uncharacterized FlgJ-related protein
MILKFFSILKYNILIYVFISIIFVVTIFFTGVYYSHLFKKEPDINYGVIYEKKNFSVDEFISLLIKMKVKYPHIVMSQSIVETGFFKSDIFISNNNLFGMRDSSKRLTTSDSTQYGYAYYDRWEDSVYDYALFQSTYLRKIKSEEEYFNYLRRNYAEDTKYVNLLKQVINREKLREHF